jgi:hypothetical protein
LQTTGLYKLRHDKYTPQLSATVHSIIMFAKLKTQSGISYCYCFFLLREACIRCANLPSHHHSDTYNTHVIHTHIGIRCCFLLLLKPNPLHRHVHFRKQVSYIRRYECNLQLQVSRDTSSYFGLSMVCGLEWLTTTFRNSLSVSSSRVNYNVIDPLTWNRQRVPKRRRQPT